MHEEFTRKIKGNDNLLFLAPMQDVTDLPFMRLVAGYGGADVYVTEYFRIHGTSRLNGTILKSITQNPTGRPVVAQMIGNDVEALVRSAKALQHYPVAGIDLNLGCPAPIVYRKCAGGGLLRDPDLVDSILGALRDAVDIPFTVKTRVGFDSPAVFETFLPIFARHSIDLLTVHGRTVKESYRPGVHYDLIAEAVKAMDCPVIANGDVDSPARAGEVLDVTGARGLMIGRGAIRAPWIFEQIRQVERGEEPIQPSGAEIYHYIETLYHAVKPAKSKDSKQVEKMKRYMNFIATGINDGAFLYEIRRAREEESFFKICREHLCNGVPTMSAGAPTA